MAKFGESVWERESVRGAAEMSKGAFVNAVSAFTVFGLAIATVIGERTMTWTPGFWTFLGIGALIPFVGIGIAMFSQNWVVSFLGYLMVVCGMGAISGIAVGQYQINSVLVAFAATAGVTVVMSVIGAIIPKSLEHWSGYLLAGLLGLIAARFAQVVLMAYFGVSPGVWYMQLVEYVSTVVFSLYIIYDWNRAMHIQRTMDNAVDVALAIFLDVINLFLSLLRIFGDSKD